MTLPTSIPVRATHDLLEKFLPLVKAGTPGEITDVGGASTVSYTVTFWPADMAGATVTLHDLWRTDLQEA